MGPALPGQLRRMHASWRAANHLSIGQIYLFDNPLLKEPLLFKHIKPRLPRLLGHRGSTPGLNLIYVAAMRLLREHYPDKNLRVRGYKEEGTATAPLDMVVLNDLDRFHLMEDVLARAPKSPSAPPIYTRPSTISSSNTNTTFVSTGTTCRKCATGFGMGTPAGGRAALTIRPETTPDRLGFPAGPLASPLPGEQSSCSNRSSLQLRPSWC